jgi:hypothetical protein
MTISGYDSYYDSSVDPGADPCEARVEPAKLRRSMMCNMICSKLSSERRSVAHSVYLPICLLKLSYGDSWFICRHDQTTKTGVKAKKLGNSHSLVVQNMSDVVMIRFSKSCRDFWSRAWLKWIALGLCGGNIEAT